MTNGYGDLAAGGMGLGAPLYDLPANTINPLAVSPDLALNPATDAGMGGIYRGMYNPLAPLGRLAGSASTTSPGVAAPTNFDMAFGDSIAAQQVNQKRIWGGVGPQYDAKNPADFNVWHTAAVSDPPSRILGRAIYAVGQNPDYFRGKNVFSAIGSNDPSQMDAIKQYLQLLKDNGVGNVVVPGLGPKVPDSESANAALKKTVEDAGFTYFMPQGIQWQPDGVHPVSSQMFDQANAALNQAAANRSTPGVDTTPPASFQPQPAAQAPPNALAPPPAPYTPYTGPHADIYNHSLYYGVDPELAFTTASIESNFNPNANIDKATQYKGVFQLGKDEWREMGGTEANRWDPTAQVNLGVARLAQIQQQLADRLGRTPTNAEIYLAHQQGVAGATALINNPNVPAAQVLKSIGVTEPGAAESHIRGNIVSKDNPESFINAPASKFVNYWNSKYDSFKGQLNTTPYATAAVVPREGAQVDTGGWGRPPRMPYTPGAAPTPGTSTTLPEVAVTGAPANPLVPAAAKEAPAGGPGVKDLLGAPGDVAAIRRALLFSMLGQTMQGRKFIPVDYDPFKVEQAGQAAPGSDRMANLMPDMGAFGARQSPVNTRFVPAPTPVEGGRIGGALGLGRRNDPGQAIAQSRFYENMMG